MIDLEKMTKNFLSEMDQGARLSYDPSANRVFDDSVLNSVLNVVNSGTVPSVSRPWLDVLTEAAKADQEFALAHQQLLAAHNELAQASERHARAQERATKARHEVYRAADTQIERLGGRNAQYHVNPTLNDGTVVVSGQISSGLQSGLQSAYSQRLPVRP